MVKRGRVMVIQARMRRKRPETEWAMRIVRNGGTDLEIGRELAEERS